MSALKTCVYNRGGYRIPGGAVVATEKRPAEFTNQPLTERKEGDAIDPGINCPMPNMSGSDSLPPATVQSPAEAASIGTAASPVVLREGGVYLDRKGREYGPIFKSCYAVSRIGVSFTWHDAEPSTLTWGPNGQVFELIDDDHDLISEVTQPDAKPDADKLAQTIHSTKDAKPDAGTVEPEWEEYIGDGKIIIGVGDQYFRTDTKEWEPSNYEGCRSLPGNRHRRKLPAPPVQPSCTCTGNRGQTRSDCPIHGIDTNIHVQPKEEKREWTIWKRNDPVQSMVLGPDCENLIVIPKAPAEQTIARLERDRDIARQANAECHERIDWLEKQREVEIQAKDEALDSADERLGEITKQRQTIREQAATIERLTRERDEANTRFIRAEVEHKEVLAKWDTRNSNWVDRGTFNATLAERDSARAEIERLRSTVKEAIGFLRIGYFAIRDAAKDDSK